MSAREEIDRYYDECPSCAIHVDKEGRWFHRGAPIIHRDLLALFYASLDVDENGRYVIRFNDQVCQVDVEDTPFVILRTDFLPDSEYGEKDRFVLYLVDDTIEDLVPETLWIGPGHVPYCKIRGGKFKARFSRAAYYQLTRYLQEDAESGEYFLKLNDKKYYVKEMVG